MNLRVGDAAHGRLVAMLDDPECVGDLLLVGLGLLGLCDLGRDQYHEMATMADAVGKPAQVGRRGEWVRNVIGDDARRYQSPSPPYGAPCEAPMIRRDYCGKRSHGGFIAWRDPGTGELTWVKHCPKHREWAAEVEAARRTEKPADGWPTPMANHGGVLARHFPEIDWHDLWPQCRTGWVPPPEGEPRPVPRFSLIVGGDDGTGDGGASLALAPAGRNA